MKIVVIGTGYVGLVTGTCLATPGNDVTCVDIDTAKVERLNHGEIPIYEPGLAELVHERTEAGRLHFTTDTPAACEQAEVLFLAVGTPEGTDGHANLSSFWKAIEGIAPHLHEDTLVVTKSTVPIGTNRRIEQRLQELTGLPIPVASNPEFLREGSAVYDFLHPDRVVVGVREQRAGEILRELYLPFLPRPELFVVMSTESAEMTKYASNTFLAAKISFINEIAALCDLSGANVDEVRQGMALDERIGNKFLNPGVGYGGSCFPKDVRALKATARELGMTAAILEAVDSVNLQQKTLLPGRILHYFRSQDTSKQKRHALALDDKIIAVWGLAFKPKTDDIREAPSLVLLDRLLEEGATLQVYDPEAMGNIRAIYGDQIVYSQSPEAAIQQADALALVTEWPIFREPDWKSIKEQMRSPVVFDGRNIYDPQAMEGLGFHYESVGRPLSADRESIVASSESDR
ncbi:Nucleotide sugar dehydrogenase [Planctomycetales bacterium 10988]|nr:Nucleotide sugar dehydrogenase [Planctomycetales bacterium 10988]